MALCGFRADNYDFGLLEGEGLAKVLSLLEAMAAGGPAAGPASEEDARLLERLLEAGLLVRREGRVSVSPRGTSFLETCRAVIAARPAGSSPSGKP